MIIAQQIGKEGSPLTNDQIKKALKRGLSGSFSNSKVLVLIPDHTRTLPLPFLFRTVTDLLSDATQLDFMVALGTHPALDQEALRALVGITEQERRSKYHHIGLINHAWDDPGALTQIGSITQDEIKEIMDENWHPSLGGDVDVRINRRIFDYDQILILGPTFPHEVAGFSGGAKYLFPGISGPEMINSTHWMGALAGVTNTIGIKNTTVREMIHKAAKKITVPLTLAAFVVEGEDIAGIFIGDLYQAWEGAVKLSRKRHIRYYDKPFQQVLSCAPPMYDELWTAAKAMYKLEPVVEAGGEIIIYAPHLREISYVHGKYIQKVGYHVLEYFLEQWEQYQHIPLGVLAHSTHVRGGGSFSEGKERPNLKVTLASQIPQDVCENISLGYLDPAEINLNQWKNQENERYLFVPQAGEMLYRLRK